MSRRSLAFALFAVSFGTNVSTPLLLLYQERLDLSAWLVTWIFAIYPVGLAPALIYAGPASDVLGRRRVMVPGVVLSAVASMVMMVGADRLGLLLLGRFLLGAVSGIVFTVASAWMLELSVEDGLWGARLTGLVLYGGFGGGALLSGVLAQWAPGPLTLPYLVHLVLVAAGLLALRRIQETVTPDRSRRIRPRLGIPPGTLTPFLKVMTPTALGVFGFPSLALGLFPVLLRPAMGSIAVLVTGLVAGLGMGSIVPAQAAVARIGPGRAAPIGLAVGSVGCLLGTLAFGTDLWPLLIPATVAMGAASGLCLTSGLRMVDLTTSPGDRGALTGSFYAVAYAGMTMPVLVASLAGSDGFVPVLAGVTLLGGLGAAWLHRSVRAEVALDSRAFG